MNEPQKAAGYFEKALTTNPDDKRSVVDYALFLLRRQQFDRALELGERIGAEDEAFKFDYYLIRGKALEGIGKYREAITNLLEGNKIYDSDTRLLNSLGYCYFKTGEKAKALEALRASLRLNPDQESIKKLVQEVENLGRKYGAIIPVFISPCMEIGFVSPQA